MLGGYYLGQLYLGESGSMQSGLLTIQDSFHDHTVDNINIIQQHLITVQDALHGHTVDNIILTENKTLVIASSLHSLTSGSIVLVQAHTIAVEDTTHGLTSDNIVIIQKHLLNIANTSHSLVNDGDLVLNQFLLLNTPHSSVMGVASPTTWISQNNILVVDDSLLGLIDNSRRIINLADYQYFTGTYMKRFSQSGVLEEQGTLWDGTLILQNKQLGSFEPSQIDAGVYIKHTDKQGQLN